MPELLKEIFELCIVPLLGLVAGYFVTWVRSKVAEAKQRSKNELVDKYLTIFESTVTNCVLATKQTYVDALKGQNAFTAEAQKEAFQKTYEAIIASLSDDAIAALNEVTKDLPAFITEAIEATIQKTK